jgi:hypothetical protein
MKDGTFFSTGGMDFDFLCDYVCHWRRAFLGEQTLIESVVSAFDDEDDRTHTS